MKYEKYEKHVPRRKCTKDILHAALLFILFGQLKKLFLFEIKSSLTKSGLRLRIPGLEPETGKPWFPNANR